MAPPFPRILLATDHGDFDVGAERVAFELARRWKVPLMVVQPLVTNPEYEAVAPELAARADDAVHTRSMELQAAAKAAGIGLELVVRRGAEAWREIVADATERRADLVIARRRGHHGFLAGRMVGEIVGKVAMLAPCSVLLAPRAVQPWTRGVLAAVDDSPGTRDVAAVAARIAAHESLPLVVTCVVAKQPADARERAAAVVADALAVAKNSGVTAEGSTPEGRPHEEIGRIVASRGLDLVVIGRHGHTRALERLILGGTAQKIIGHATTPVLVVRT
jgi:nucleotide-binding universal stress UspA family protein